MKWWERIIDKAMSARFLMALALTFTYCLVIIKCVEMVLAGKMTVETFLSTLGGFVIIVTMVTKSYYERQDRHKNGGNGDGTTH